MKYISRIILVLAVLLVGGGATKAGTTISGLTVKNTLATGANVSAKFYDGGTTAPGSSYSPGAEITSIEAGHYLVVEVTPATGYWTYDELLTAQTAGSTSLAETRGIVVPEKLTAFNIQADGKGFYYYQIPATCTEANGYSSVVFRGSAIPKIDLATATQTGTAIKTATRADNWTATIVLSNVSFVYSGSAQGPTISSLTITDGTKSFTTVSDHVAISNNSQTNVGNYQATLSAVATGCLLNTFKPDFKITTKEDATITVTMTPESVVYNGAEQEPTITVSDGTNTLTKGSDYTVTYKNSKNDAVTKPKNADTYTVAIVSVTGANESFNITKTYTITKKVLTIKADAKEKNFGDADPALTYTSEGLITGDAITGALTRDEGEDVGTYDIKQGTLTAGDNYTIEYTGAKLTIKAAEPTPGPIDPDPIIPDPATVVVTIKGHINTAVYDGAEHSVSGYDVSISNAQYKESDFTFTGEAKAACTDAGIAYMGVTVTQFTNKNNSFIVTFEVEDGYMQIDPRNITVSVADKSVEYNGSEQSGNTSYTFSNVVDGQTATITYTPAKGTSAGTYDNGSFANDLKVMSGSRDVTDNYSLWSKTKGKLIITSLDNENFNVSFDANLDNVVYDGNGQKPKVIVKDGDKTLVEGQDYTLTYNQNVNAGVAYVTVTGIGNYAGSSATKSFTIGKKPLTIKADAKTKVTGEADPALTYTSEGLVAGDKITGALTRDAGEAAGTYAIKQGTLSAGDNYAITYVGANLTITETVMPDVPTPPALTLYNITVVPATGGEILTSDTQAEAGKQINLIVNTTKGYHLTNIIVSTVSGGSVSTFVAFDAQGNAYYAFLMPSADVIVKSIFEADQPDQNIFICKAKYGEVISHLLHANPGQQVNLRALLGEDVELDQLKVVNSKGEELKIYTIMDPTEGLIYFFFMKGDQVVIYDSFKGTNGTVDESQPVQPDNLLYLMSDIYNGFIKTSDGVEGVQMAMSLVANILAKFTPEGELSVKVGEDDLNIALLNLQSGWQIKFDFTGLINVLNPKMLGLTDGATLKSGQIYNILTSGMLELLIPSTYMPLLLQAITIMGPEPDPTAIYGLKADGTAVDLYDLRGRKVDTTNLRKGIYIHDGRKVVIK